MNVVSYANGDTFITDFPDCTHSILASAAQNLNDSICSHIGDVAYLGRLCSECSAEMYSFEPLLINTRPPLDPQLDIKLSITLALEMIKMCKNWSLSKQDEEVVKKIKIWLKDSTSFESMPWHSLFTNINRPPLYTLRKAIETFLELSLDPKMQCTSHALRALVEEMLGFVNITPAELHTLIETYYKFMHLTIPAVSQDDIIKLRDVLTQAKMGD